MNIRRGDMKLRQLLAALEEIKKDLSYTQSLQEKWEKERRRFPILYEYIGKQSDFFREKMEKVLEAEVKEESVDAYIRWRLQQVGKESEGGERAAASVVGLQTQESAAQEVPKLPQQKSSGARRLAERGPKTSKQDVSKNAANAGKLAQPHTRVADEMERQKGK